MKKFVFSDYDHLGVWGIIAEFCFNHDINHWLVRYRFGNEYEFVSPPLPASHLSDEETAIDISSLSAIPETKNFFWDIELRLAGLPVLFKGKEYFTLFFSFSETSFALLSDVLHDFHHYLHLLLAYELSFRLNYPSYYPLPYFPEQEFSSVISALRSKNHFYFLNGQKGTGKEIFTNRFALYHFGFRLPQKTEEFSSPQIYDFVDYKKHPVVLWFVPELATLEPEWQKKILDEVSRKNDSKELKSIFIFVGSVYSSKALLEGNLIPESLYQVCEKNRILFPSLSRRRFELEKLLEFIAKFSFPYFSQNFFVADKARLEYLIRQIDKGYFKENFDSLYHWFLKEAKPSGTLYKDIQEKNLEELVADLEKEAIRLAYETVGHSQQKIADYLGISRGSLQYKIRQYEIPYQTWEHK